MRCNENVIFGSARSFSGGTRLSFFLFSCFFPDLGQALPLVPKRDETSANHLTFLWSRLCTTVRNY